ncbi:hypothetical protein FRC02_005954 [Tulasnella sp. 418]|nr:hypothetical protein FRC02_005954 [Tulasnella sp. 418]
MSLADMNTTEISLRGPPGLTHYLASMRHYLMRTNTLVDLAESATPPSSLQLLRPEPIFKDNLLTVYGIHLLPSSCDNSEEPSTNLPSPGEKRRRSTSPGGITKRRKTISPHSSPPDIKAGNSVNDPLLHRQKVLEQMFRKPGEAPKFTPNSDPYTEIDRPMASFSLERSKLLGQALPRAG